MGASKDEFVVGVDIGGTFTDCVVIDGAGRRSLNKAFSTPPDFSHGIVDAVSVAAEAIGLSLDTLLSRTRLFLHSTTVAENAIVNGELAEGGLISTRGFEDTLSAMRGGYGRWSGLTDDQKRDPIQTDKPPPVIPRSRVLGINERTDRKGNVLRDPNPEEIRDCVRELLESGVDAIGVSLLWASANPKNEQSVGELVKELAPGTYLTLSHEIAPILGEYERTSTVALNIRLGPVGTRYLENLRLRLEELGFQGRLLVMQAHGGLLPIDRAIDRPIGMVESGPVSGLVGCQQHGNSMGLGNIIATDMGGTTFKVGIIREGLVEYQREPMVFRYHYALPKLDVVSLGLAGGSIIWVDPRTGIPQVGPKSAGSYPGPVCYDHGGEDPTITDIDAILGYLNPKFFLGGRSSLNIEKARAVLNERVARPLGLDTVEGAAAIYRLANSMIYDLLHKVTVQRGLDPRNFALFSYGGTAGMHVAAFGNELGVDRIVIPHAASVLGAFGLVVSDVVHEEQTTHPMRAPVDVAAVDGVFSELEGRVVDQLRTEGFSNSEIHLTRSIDMSYARQVHILTVPLERDVPELSESLLESTIQRFETLYAEKYGKDSGYREAGIDLVTFRVRGYGLVKRPEVKPEELGGADPSAAQVEIRDVWVDQESKMRKVPGYDFERMSCGNQVGGPAVIWTPITTVILSPTQLAHIDGYRNIVVMQSTEGSTDND